jgi:hypothetical protein
MKKDKNDNTRRYELVTNKTLPDLPDIIIATSKKAARAWAEKGLTTGEKIISLTERGRPHYDKWVLKARDFWFYKGE